jgi:futalosine hydrolase
MASQKRILLTAATEMELEAVRKYCAEGHFPKLDLELQSAGVGMVNTAMHITEALSRSSFDLAINIGIAGSFDPNIRIGDVVQVTEDHIAWLGAEDHGRFIPAETMGLCSDEEVVTKATHEIDNLKKVKAITVNMAHGNAESIEKTIRQYAPQIESMEGAAFFRACARFDTPSLQIRAISNRVEPRNRDAWDIPLALNNLTAAVIKVLEDLNHGD